MKVVQGLNRYPTWWQKRTPGGKMQPRGNHLTYRGINGISGGQVCCCLSFCTVPFGIRNWDTTSSLINILKDIHLCGTGTSFSLPRVCCLDFFFILYLGTDFNLGTSFETRDLCSTDPSFGGTGFVYFRGFAAGYDRKSWDLQKW